MKAYQLFARAILFTDQANPDIPEHAAAYLQVPGVVVSSPADNGARGAKGGFDRLESLDRALPLFAPEAESTRSRQVQTGPGVAAPETDLVV